MNNFHLIKKIFFSSFFKFISSLGLILFNITIVFLTDKNTLGVLTSAISLIVFLSIFTKFGLNLATLKFSSIFFEKKDISKINKLILQTILISGFISIIISCSLIFFENEIAFEIYKDNEIKGVLKIFAIALPFFTFLQLQKSLFKSFKVPELSSLSDIGSILFLTIIMIAFFEIIQINLTIYRISIFFLFSCLMIFSFNNFILFYVVLKNLNLFDIKKISKSNTGLVKTLPDYFSIDFVNFSTVWGSIFLCSFFYDFTTVGSFSSVYWLAYSLLFFPLILNSIYAPYFAINANNNDLKKQKKLFYQNRNLSVIITLPILLILLLFSDFFLKLIFQINSSEFNVVFKILLINSFLRIVFGPQNLFLNMSDNQKHLKFILIICSVIQIFLVLLSLIFLNLTWVSVAFLFSNFIKHLWLYKVLLEKFKIKV